MTLKSKLELLTPQICDSQSSVTASFLDTHICVSYLRSRVKYMTESLLCDNNVQSSAVINHAISMTIAYKLYLQHYTT